MWCRDPVHRSTSHPPIKATAIRRELATSGHSSLPAPWEKKYSAEGSVALSDDPEAGVQLEVRHIASSRSENRFVGSQ